MVARDFTSTDQSSETNRITWGPLSKVMSEEGQKQAERNMQVTSIDGIENKKKALATRLFDPPP